LAVPAVPYFTIVALQAAGAGDGVQKVAFALFFAALVYVSFAIWARKRQATRTPTPPRKIFVGFAVWLLPAVYPRAGVGKRPGPSAGGYWLIGFNQTFGKTAPTSVLGSASPNCSVH
jgi:hypothetical protein